MSALQQYGRRMRVEVGPPGKAGKSWSELHMAATVQKKERGRPDPAEIELRNLSRTDRGYLEGEGLAVLVFAGYEEMPPLLFTGTVDKVEHSRDGTDWVTRIEARATGGGAYNQARLTELWRGPLSSAEVLRRLARAAGLGLQLHPELEEVTFDGGFAAAGRVVDSLDAVTEELGARWALSGGQITVTPLGLSTRPQAVVLSPDTGLIGSPKKVRKNGRETGQVEVACQLNGRIEPGDIVKVESEQVTGFYRVQDLTHRAETEGATFTTELKAAQAR